MDRGAAVLVTALVGGVLAAQAPINARLGEDIGRLPAAVVSFVIGTVLLLAIALAAGGLGGVRGYSLPWYYLAGGVLGALYVTTVLITVKPLGAGGLTAATITGQLGASIVIDRLGMFGLERQPISLARIAGVVLLAAGTYLIVAD
ncbi:MAG: DMT family transporter [Actinobacteria bacterium]|nr:DMT family transporter [Actinomycetota bacterium]